MAQFIIGLATTIFVLGILTAVEVIAPMERYPLRSRLRGFAFTLVELAVGAMVVLALRALWDRAGVPPIEMVNLTPIVGDIVAVAISVIAFDFLAYWHHRFQHRFLWPIHALHHAQTELHAANAYNHVLERVSRFVMMTLPFSLFDFHFPVLPLAIGLILRTLESYIHCPTTAHLGPLAWIFVDNRFHRIHHSVEPRHFDKNFGICFSVWDRLFGTAYEPRGEWPATGIAAAPPPNTLQGYLLFPMTVSAASRAKTSKVGSVAAS